MNTAAEDTYPAATDVFDWSSYFESEGGFRFQKLCVELLTALRMTVREAARGGHDEGKDIIVFECPDPSWMAPPQPACFVECKSRKTSAPALKQADVHGVIMNLLRSTVHRVLIMTNHEFNNELVNYILAVNTNEHWGVKITWMEREHLEEVLLTQPDVCRRYFPGLDVDAARARHEGRSPGAFQRIIAELKPLSPFAGADNELRLSLSNTFSEAVDVRIVSADLGTKDTIRLAPFEARTFTIPLPSSATTRWPSVEVSGTTASGYDTVAPCNVPGRPLIRVDHIYVDPYGWLDRLSDLAARPGCTLVLGDPGAGKSRLLIETSARLKRSLHWIDLSEGSYTASLADSLSAALFGMPRAELASMPTELLERSLVQRGVAKADAKTMADLVQSSTVLDPEAAAATLAAVVRRLFVGRLLVIDNIHRIGPFDTLVLQALATPPTPLHIVLSARGNEIVRDEVKAWIASLARLQQEHVFDLGQVDRPTLLRTFVETASADRQSATFLKRFADVPSFQQFVFTLKDLKAHGFLRQDDHGRLIVGAPVERAPARAYNQLYRSLLAAACDGLPEDAVRTVLDATATYDSVVPFAFIEHTAGPGAGTVVDRLVHLELFVPDKQKPGGLHLRFDHELTHDIVYQAIGLTQRNALHEKAAAFIADPLRFHPGRDSIVLARHQAEIGACLDAALNYHEGSRYKKRSGALFEALELLRTAHATLLRHDDDAQRYDAERTILEDTFRLQRKLGEPDAELRATVGALDVLCLLLAPYQDVQGLTGRLRAYRVAVEDDPDRARGYAEEAVRILERYGSTRDLGEALVLLGNRAKNDGQYLQAARTTARAVRLLRNAQAEDLRAEALLDFGAVFLEADRGAKVPYWWERAVSVLSRLVPQDIGTLAYAKTDHAYALALFQPEAIEVPIALEQARGLAARHRLAHTQCRAAINQANWLHFEARNRFEAEKRLDEAQELADQRGYGYEAVLVAFSRLNVQGPQSNGADHFLQTIRAFLHEPAAMASGRGGDRRVRNMIVLMLAIGDKHVRLLAEKDDRGHWQRYFGIGLGQDLAAIEKGNPYFMGTGYATYY